jgi:hypothetical protein
VPKLRREDSSSSFTVVNDGFANGHARSRLEAQRIQDAEAFELQGLISEDDIENHSNNSLRKEAVDEDDEEGDLAISR